MYAKPERNENWGAPADRRINSIKILQVATFPVLANSVATSPWNRFGFRSFVWFHSFCLLRYKFSLDWCRDVKRTKTGQILKHLRRIVRSRTLEANFFAYFNPKQRLNDQDILYLICCPVHRRKEVREEIKGEIGEQGSLSEVSASRGMIPERDETFVSVSGGIITLKDMELCCLRFVQTFSRAVQRSMSPGIE